MSEKKVDLWTWHYDAEDLNHATIADAVESYLSERSPLDEIPETLTVYGYARRNPTRNDCGRPLETILEALDEEYGEDGVFYEPTDRMKAAEQAFIEAVLKDYTAFTCVKVMTQHVVIAEYQ